MTTNVLYGTTRRKVNINECFAGTAICHRNAACEDRDATVNGTLLYECTCPPGMVGDGVTSCDLPKYETQLTLSQPGTTVQEFDETAFKKVSFISLIVLSAEMVPALFEASGLTLCISDAL